MREFFSQLKYLSALDVVGFMINRGLKCTVEPMGADRYRVLFPRGGHGEAAKAKLAFLRAMPIHDEV